MRGDQDVARHTVEEREAGLEILDRSRSFRELEPVRRNGRHAVGVKNIKALARFAGFPGPTRSAGCVAGSKVRSDAELTGVERLAVLKRLGVFNRGDRRNQAELWIVPVEAGLHQYRRAAFADRHPGSTQALQPGNAARMVEMN